MSTVDLRYGHKSAGYEEPPVPLSGFTYGDSSEPRARPDECPYCGPPFRHTPERCPYVRAIDYYPSGKLRRVEMVR